MRWLFRGPAPAADRLATEAESQRLYHAAVDEARLERIAELEQALADEKHARAVETAQLRAALAPYLAKDWMTAGVRARRRLEDGPTVVVPEATMRRFWRSTARGGRVR